MPSKLRRVQGRVNDAHGFRATAMPVVAGCPVRGPRCVLTVPVAQDSGEGDRSEPPSGGRSPSAELLLVRRQMAAPRRPRFREGRTDENQADILAETRHHRWRAEVRGLAAKEHYPGALHCRAGGPRIVRVRTGRALFRRSGWRDRHGDVSTLGRDGLLHTPETRAFPREHVEKMRAARAEPSGFRQPRQRGVTEP